jgi:hypothetical protein
MRQYRETNPEVFRRADLKKYGVTLEDYDRVYEAQGGVCAVCHRPETRKTKDGKVAPLSVEHNHETNEFRALACSRCNLALGLIGEDPEVAKGLVAYIESWVRP